MEEEAKGCLTKAELVEAIYENLPFDKQKAGQIVEDWIELIKTGLGNDGKVMMSGFGSFLVQEKNARPGRNPQTGNRIVLGARRNVKFKPSQSLKRQLNPGGISESDEGDDEEE